MRKSNNEYGDFEEFDDPVAQTEKNFRREFLDQTSSSRSRMIRLYDYINNGATADSNTNSSGRTSPDHDEARKSVDNTVDMAADVLRSEALQGAIASLITRVLESEQFRGACQSLLKELWKDLIRDPETSEQIVQLLNNAIQNKQIQRAVKKLVVQLIQDKEVYDELTKLLVRLGQEQQVLQATQDLLTESAHNALNDPEILDHSMEFATDVVGDDIVQRTSGEALRNTVTYAVRPGLSTFLSILGVALIGLGILAFGNARTTEEESAVVSHALQHAIEAVVTTATGALRAILAFPGKLLSALWAAPTKLLQGLFTRIEKAGTAVSAAIQYVLNLPSVILTAMWVSIGRAGGAMTDTLLQLWNSVGSSISDSFIGITARSVVEMSSKSLDALVSFWANLPQHVSTMVDATIGSVSTSIQKTLMNCGEQLHRWEKQFEQMASVVGQQAGAAVDWVATKIAESPEAIEASSVALRNVMVTSSRRVSEKMTELIEKLMAKMRGGGDSTARV